MHESQSGAHAARDPRENPVEPDPDPKKRLLMQSAPSAASDSGQQGEKRSVTGTESGARAGDPLEMGTGESTIPIAPPASTRRRIVTESEPVAVTTQEAVDGCREKAMRIASIEQVELESIKCSSGQGK